MALRKILTLLSETKALSFANLYKETNMLGWNLMLKFRLCADTINLDVFGKNLTYI